MNDGQQADAADVLASIGRHWGWIVPAPAGCVIRALEEYDLVFNTARIGGV